MMEIPVVTTVIRSDLSFALKMELRLTVHTRDFK